jgi:hypothetical protein
MLSECKHFYHSECLRIWVQQQMRCPNCRVQVSLPKQQLSIAFVRHFAGKCPWTMVMVAAVWLGVKLR